MLFNSVFFSCVKPKSVRETCFCLFWSFFHGLKIAFTHTFFTFFTHTFRTLFCFHGHFFLIFRTFTGTFWVSRTLCYLFFSRRLFSFSRALFSIFFTQVIYFFTQEKKNTAFQTSRKLKGIPISLIKNCLSVITFEKGLKKKTVLKRISSLFD